MLSSAALSTGATQYEISDLPEEILLMIFKCYLSVNERKTVKLVCKAWFEVCNVPLLLNNEVLTCLGVYQTTDICDLLDRSEREVLNLKFQNVKFSNSSSSFWKKNGPKVRSIYFKDCEFQNTILAEIIIFCENLLHLSLVYTTRYTSPPILCLAGVLSNNIVRQNLHSLEIEYLVSKWISNYVIHQLFSIFPNVRVLKITYVVVINDFEKLSLDQSELTNRNISTFSPILNYLIASANQIEKLKLHFPTSEFSTNFVHRILETLTAMTRLTELFLFMRGNPQAEYVEALIRSKQLKSLELSMDMISSAEKLLLLLLSNRDLQFLKISVFNRLIVTETFLHKLMSSSLKSLIIDDAISVRDPDACVSRSSTPNTVLRNLFLTSYNLHEHIRPWFLLTFQNLHHLGLSKITNSELESIFSNQNRMDDIVIYSKILLHIHFFPSFRRNLVIFLGNRLVSDWFRRINYVLQTELKSLCLRGYHEAQIVTDRHHAKLFPNIEYLSLPGAPTYTFFKSLPLDQIFSNLRFLRVEISTCYGFSPSDFLTSAHAMPSLEGLCVTYDNSVSVDFWSELCMKLSRLRYIQMKKMETNLTALNFRDEDFQKIFSVCPSLRALIHDSNFEETPTSYYFDTLKKKAVRKVDNYLYSLVEPRLGVYDGTPHWLKF